MIDFIKAFQGSEAIHRLGWTLLHTLWLGAAVAVLFIAAMLILRRRSANGRYLIGCIAMVLMIALPVAVFFMVPAPAEPLPEPVDNAGVLPAAQLPRIPITVVPEPMVQIPEPAAANRSAQGDFTVEAATASAALLPPKLPFLTRASRALEPALPWAVLAWAVGVFLLSIWQLASWIAARRFKRLASQMGDKNLIATIARFAREMRVTRPVKVLESMLVRAPTVIGWLRPVILLPLGLVTGLTPEQLQAILAHELAHIRRYDYLVNLLQSLAETLLFYHPAVWFISRRIRIERENCCDDIAVAAGAERFSYAESLLHVAQESAGKPRRLIAAVGLGLHTTGKPSRLRSRIVRLLDGGTAQTTRLSRSWPITMTFLAGIVVTALVLVNVGAQQVPKSDKSVSPAQPGEQADIGPWDNFLFIRHNEVDGAAVTSTLVLTKVTAKGFKSRDIYTKRNLNSGWDPLCVMNGKVYAIHTYGLLEIDLATGKVENLCYRISSSYYYDSGRLYANVSGGDGSRVLRVFDFSGRSYRDIVPASSHWGPGSFAVSPDHKQLAYFERVPIKDTSLRHSSRLEILNLATGKIHHPGASIQYFPPMTSSFLGEGPPFVWVDNRTILCIRTQSMHPDFRLNGMLNKLVTIDTTTGQIKDVVTIPSVPFSPFHGRIRFIREMQSSIPLLALNDELYRIDLKAGKLLEDDSIGGDYQQQQVNKSFSLSHKAKLIGQHKGNINASVSPDGEQVVWIGGYPARKLNYYNSADKTVRTVARGWFAGGFLWATDKELKATLKTPEVSKGWKTFADLPKPKPRPARSDTRKDVNEYLGFVLSTDKQQYRRHEPVKVTLTVNNKSDMDIEVKLPEIDSRVVEFAMKYPGGSKSIDNFWGSKELHPIGKVTLQPGKSVSVFKTLEVDKPGSYRIKGDYRGFENQPNTKWYWHGRLRAKPVTFQVKDSADSASLFTKKMERLIAKLRIECGKAQDWDGWSPSFNDFRGVGSEAAPFLIAAYKKEADTKFQARMGMALSYLASPKKSEWDKLVTRSCKTSCSDSRPSNQKDF